MFLDATLRRNPNLIKYATGLHQQGDISPNSYVIDVDAVEFNAREIKKKAQEHNIDLYMMTKQVGRNPELARRIAKCGIEKAVAVDPWEAIALAEAKIKLGNVGHLVQIPNSMISKILSYRPEVITVFSYEMAEAISEEAQKMDIVQDVLLKVVGRKDIVYEGQLGGFKEEGLIEEARKVNNLPNVNIAGVTAFPCFIYDYEKKKITATENSKTLLRAYEKLENQLKIKIKQINAPSATSCHTIPMLQKLGATHGEPGHALTGTTPLNGQSDQAVEIPAMVYVSEISHTFDNKAYVYGGGYYRRSKVQKALVGKDFKSLSNQKLPAEDINPESIDYYGALEIQPNQNVCIGDTVVYAFRTQIFVTRSEVVLVEGISQQNPRIIGVYDSFGKKIR
ncbi:YhfX family PLP-dependent enzyme [Proteinivorax hydrogeniformans]|uniref:YhfX family PLP-dependent enzyme n=1 Tax=Proteinivorax hydrogeniformans TaxID=1826727 RepID=A0AAU8HQU9_9FIRM